MKSDGKVGAFQNNNYLPLEGVAIDEGGDVGYFRRCDLDCCKRKCQASLRCRSFAFRDLRGGLCYLKDICLSAATLSKPSRYTTYYSTVCGGAKEPATTQPRAKNAASTLPARTQNAKAKIQQDVLKGTHPLVTTSGVEWVTSDTAECILPRCASVCVERAYHSNCTVSNSLLIKWSHRRL